MRKKFMGGGTAALLAVTMALSMVTVAPAAHADDAATWSVPTKPASITTTVDGKTARYETSAAIFGSNICAEYVGLSNVVDSPGNTAGRATASDYASNPALGIWGSSANENPDPYIANLFYNFYADAKSLEKSKDAMITFSPTSQGNGTIVEDTTVLEGYGVCTTLAKRPDIIMLRPASLEAFADQVKEINGFAKDSQYYKAKSATYVGDENYDPKVGRYDSTSLYSLLDSLYSTAQAAKDEQAIAAKQGVNLTTRYGDPTKIAMQAEQLIRGTQCYILSRLAADKKEKKTVAFVNAVTDKDNIKLMANVDPAKYFGGATHILEGMVPTVKNLANVLDPELKVADTLQYKECTIDDLAKADVIMIAPPDNGGPSYPTDKHPGTKMAGDIQDMLKEAGYKDLADKPIFSCNANATTGQGQMQIDTLQMTITGNSFAYPEYLNEMQMMAYYYETLYHVKADALQTALTMNCKDTLTLADGVSFGDLATYKADDVRAKLEAGVAYYEANRRALVTEYPYLYMTDYYDAEALKPADAPQAKPAAKKVTQVTVNAATVTAKAVKKAIGANAKTVTTVVLGKKVKKVAAKAFAGTNVKTVVVKTTKLKKAKSVKNAFKGSKVKTVKVPKAKKKAYKKIFAKKTVGKKVAVK